MNVIRVVCTDSNIKYKVQEYCNNREDDDGELHDGEQLINDWDTSQVTNMSGLFADESFFNEDISRWDVSNVTNMSNMFREANRFNQSLNTWNVENVIDMSNMFTGAYRFNQELNAWNVANVINMSNMFKGANAFNQQLNAWILNDNVYLKDFVNNAFDVNNLPLRYNELIGNPRPQNLAEILTRAQTEARARVQAQLPIRAPQALTREQVRARAEAQVRAETEVETQTLTSANFLINPNLLNGDDVMSTDTYNLGEYLKEPHNVAFYVNKNKIFLFDKEITLQTFYENPNFTTRINGHLCISLRKCGITTGGFFFKSVFHKIINTPDIKCVYVNLKPSKDFRDIYPDPSIYQIQTIDFDYSIVYEEEEINLTHDRDDTDDNNERPNKNIKNDVKGGKRK